MNTWPLSFGGSVAVFISHRHCIFREMLLAERQEEQIHSLSLARLSWRPWEVPSHRWPCWDAGEPGPQPDPMLRKGRRRCSRAGGSESHLELRALSGMAVPVPLERLLCFPFCPPTWSCCAVLRTVFIHSRLYWLWHL